MTPPTPGGTTTPAAPAINFDPFDPATRADPYPSYRRLRELDPVHRSPRGHWLLTRYADCVRVLRDRRFGHGTRQLLQANTFRRPVEGRSLPFILLDPPEHTRLRALANKAFTPRMVARLEPRVLRVVDELLDTALDSGTVDLVAALAHPLPVTVISEMLGVPLADRDRIRDLSGLVALGVDPDFNRSAEQLRQRDSAFTEFDEYFRALLRERQRKPARDLLSALQAVRDRDGGLTEGELLTTCILLYVAGHETTMDLIANGALALLRHRDQWERLRSQPQLAESAVEELLRFDAPTQMSRRTALAEVELDGHRIGVGEQVVVIRGAANRDPAAFPDPDRLDLGRADNHHLAFDGGIHFCLGAPLARLEGRLALTRLVQRAPKAELATDTLRYRENLIIRGLVELPMHLR